MIHLHSLSFLRRSLILKRRLQPILNVGPLKQPEPLLRPTHAHHAQTRIIHRQLLVLTQTLLQRPQRMPDQLLPTAGLELVQVPLEIGPGHLAARADAARHHLVGHAAGLELEEVGPRGVDAGDQEADAVRPLAVLLGVDLSAVADAGRDLGELHGAVVGEAGGERLLFHEVGEDAGVGGEAGERDAVVGVDFDDLFLIGRQFLGISLEGWQLATHVRIVN